MRDDVRAEVEALIEQARQDGRLAEIRDKVFYVKPASDTRNKSPPFLCLWFKDEGEFVISYADSATGNIYLPKGLHYDIYSGLISLEKKNLQNGWENIDEAEELAQESSIPSYTQYGFDKGPFARGDLVADRYKILGILGTGGYAAVYVCWDIEAKGLRALKFPYLARILDPEVRENALELSRREYSILKPLQHHNIVKVYEEGEYQDSDNETQHYYVMEYIRGRNLESFREMQGDTTVIDQESYTILDVLSWAEAIAGALDYLHHFKEGLAVVFRDIKSENVVIESGTGRAVLVDFGFAKQWDPVEPEVRAGEWSDRDIYPPQVKMGRKGSMIGTEGYSAPEQYRGYFPPQVDIYSLGVTLWELLSGIDPRGEAPFKCNREDLRLTTQRLDHWFGKGNAEFLGEVFAELLTVIDKAAAYEIADRYQAAEEMLADIRSIRSKLEAIYAAPPADHAKPRPGRTAVDSFGGVPDSLMSAQRADYLKAIAAILPVQEKERALYIASWADYSNLQIVTNGVKEAIFIDGLPYYGSGETSESEKSLCRSKYFAYKRNVGYASMVSWDERIGVKQYIYWELEAMGARIIGDEYDSSLETQRISFILPGETAQKSIIYFQVRDLEKIECYPESLIRIIRQGLDFCMQKSSGTAGYSIRIPPEIINIIAVSLDSEGVIVSDSAASFNYLGNSLLRELSNDELQEIRKIENKFKLNFGYGEVCIIVRKRQDDANLILLAPQAVQEIETSPISKVIVAYRKRNQLSSYSEDAPAEGTLKRIISKQNARGVIVPIGTLEARKAVCLEVTALEWALLEPAPELEHGLNLIAAELLEAIVLSDELGCNGSVKIGEDLARYSPFVRYLLEKVLLLKPQEGSYGIVGETLEALMS